MRVLALDTSSNVASAAIIEDGKLLGENILNHKKTHSQKIMVMIEELFGDLELTVHDIDVFAAANGPGSFTGLRIGVATVKALAHSVDKPVVGVSTLAGLAYNLPYTSYIIVPVMDARRNQVYTASYIWENGTLKELEADSAMSIEDRVSSCRKMGKVIFVGDGVNVHRDYIAGQLGENAYFAPVTALMQRASSVAALALEKANRGETEHYSALKPFYLRKSQAEREYDEKHGKEE